MATQRGFSAAKRVSAPDGQVWLIGNWHDDDLIVGNAGRDQVAVIGRCSVTATALTEIAAKAETVADLDRFAANMDGCAYLIAVIADELRVQGTIAGTRRIFHTTLTSGTTMTGAGLACLTIAANRPDLLAELTRAEVNADELAVRMMFQTRPAPLDLGTMWRGISSVSPDSYLRLSAARAPTRVRWWSPPAPESSLTEGAERFRDRLAQAVALRTPSGVTVGCDLSGGLDSTPLSFLAAQGRAKVITLTVASADRAHDDADWAARAAAAMPDVERLVLPTESFPGMFSGVDEIIGGPDPYLWWRRIGRTINTAALLKEHGASRHIVGHGGDEILLATAPHIDDLIVRRPWLALRQLAATRAIARWPLPALARALLSRGSYENWLRKGVAELTDPLPPVTAPVFGWGLPLRMPPWASRGAVDIARRELLRILDEGHGPLADNRYQHDMMQFVRKTGRDVYLTNEITSGLGVSFETPLLDDRVVEASLAVRPEEKRSPYQYKPLMAAAMREVMPAALLNRTTKGEFSADVLAGMRAHRAGIDRLLDGSLMVRAGLIDHERLARALSLYPKGLPMAALDLTIAGERWWRSTV